jgi:hypothetical protein
MIVIIPIHNQAKNLYPVLTAYVKQTIAPKAIVLVCDRCADESAQIAATFIAAFKTIGCDLHVTDTADSSMHGFGAGRTRDVGIHYALANNLNGPFLFSDGDCIPSPSLVERHALQLAVEQPRITCGLRYETLPEGQTPDFPLLGWKTLGLDVQDDLRLNASWCKHLVFGSCFDRLVLNPLVFERSWICWSCNLGMNLAAIDVCRRVNGILDGDENRVFNSSFDGRWGGEDGFVGLTMFRTGNEVVALDRKSYVTHIWHKRNHTNQEHLLQVTRKDMQLAARCVDQTLTADATVLTGLRRLTENAFDLGFLETATQIDGSALLTRVAALYDEPFVPEAIKLLLTGTLRYRGGIPAIKYSGDREDLGKQCFWAKSQMDWIAVAVNGNDLSKGLELIPRQDKTK